MIEQKRYYFWIFLGVAMVLSVIIMMAGGVFEKERSEEIEPIVLPTIKIEEDSQQYNPKIDIDNINIDIESDPEDFSNDDLDGIDEFESEFESSVVDEDIFK